MPRHIIPLAFLICTTATAQTIEITATRDRARQQDTAAMTVVGRDELLRYGDQSLGDALRRVPGITVAGVPGRGGEIRMRGLGNGYTRVLLDGQPAPAGFAIESLAPEQIERVEVQRVASAETGAQAIAGTINIILRKTAARPERDLKLGVGVTHDRVTPDLTLQLSDQRQSGPARLAASLGVVATSARADIASDEEKAGFDGSGQPGLARRTFTHQSEHRPTINLTPRLVWTLANGDTITSQNFLRFLALDMGTQARERTSLGAPTSFPETSVYFRAHTSTLRNDVNWLRQFDDGARFEMQLGRSHFERRGINVFSGKAPVASDSVQRIVDSTASENTWSLTGKASLAARGPHTIVAGWDSASGERTETRLERIDEGAPGIKEISTARLHRLALYVQDDWTVTPALSLSLGARGELFDIASEGNVLEPVRRRLYAGGPLLQARLKTSKEGQVRFGVTRTFRLPSLTRLSMRRYTVDNDNSPLTPDEEGNPALLPERAWGLDGAYEHYFDKASMVSVSAYARRIDDVTLTRITQRAVGWVATPVNAGRADTHGIELEWKAPFAGSALRANAARNWSRVDRLARPIDHLPEQAPWSGAVSIERRLLKLPLLLAASYTVQGGARSGLLGGVEVTGARQATLDASALWRIDARSAWRLSATNLAAQRRTDTARYLGPAGSLIAVTGTPTWPAVRLVMETRL